MSSAVFVLKLDWLEMSTLLHRSGWPLFDSESAAELFLRQQWTTAKEAITFIVEFQQSKSLRRLPYDVISKITGCTTNAISKAKHGPYYKRVEEKKGTVLSRASKEELLTRIENDSAIQEPWTLNDIYNFAREHSKKTSIDPSWPYAFVPDNADRICYVQVNPRSETRMAVSTFLLDRYIEKLEKELTGTHPAMTINADEMGYQYKKDSFTQYVVTSVKFKSQSMHYPIKESEQKMSVMGAISLYGQMLPIYISFRDDTVINSLYSHGLDKNPLVKWDHSEKGVDNVRFHLNEKCVGQLRDNGIQTLTLVPNSTHLTQPLHVSTFGILKKTLSKLRLAKGEGDLGDLVDCMVSAFQTACTQENIRGAFRFAGIGLSFTNDGPVPQLDTTNLQKIRTQSELDH
ncbi:hypothetical protein BLNAU_2486 [Blattamonas nauphoetae]|uniref:Transposase n=1 Tax=Blattamonas nauphoetae TaxID=2049346 RepID=A0ABQ9YFU7_9EUKA|nr:hypothetical protein BLNAU_2486 [Blattamonas nauphoetae]